MTHSITDATFKGYGQDVYLWLGIGLLAPIVLLPLRLAFGDGSPAFGVIIESRWLLLGGCLLLVACAADTTLSLVERYQRDGEIGALVAYCAASWVFVFVLLVPFITSSPAHGWWLSALFAVHAWRAGLALWRGQTQWWLWYAWWRDCTAAVSLFFWLAYWPVY
jgi:hypothetical protein